MIILIISSYSSFKKCLRQVGLKNKKNEEEEIFGENETGMGEDNAMVVFPHSRSTIKEGTSALQSGPTKSDKSIKDINVSKENNVDDNGLKDLNREDMSAKTSFTNIKNESTSQIFPCKDIDMYNISDETIVVDKEDKGLKKLVMIPYPSKIKLQF